MGRKLDEFKANIDRPLAAILTLNTIAHTVGAIGVGEQAAILWQETHPVITNYFVPLLMTLAILILSELIPKTLGANYWPELAPFTVRALSIAIILLAPLIWMSQLLTQWLRKDPSKSVFTRTDFLALAEIGVKEGVIEPQESNLIRSIMRFNSIQVAAIMTPKSVVKTASESSSIKAFIDENKELPFSRIPIYQTDHRERLVGFVLKDELLEKMVAAQGDAPMHTLKREIISVRETCPIPDLFTRFIERREHIASVTDSAGGLLGVVTMEDVIETLLGMEIVDETDTVVDMQTLAREHWRKRARRLGLWREDTDQ